jgi:ribosome-associated translation inhibitor RaiA
VKNVNHNIEFKNFEADQATRGLIDTLIKKLKKKAKHFPADEVFLRLMTEENPARTLYRVSVTMEIPGEAAATKKTLPAKEERHDLTEALRDAFIEIDRQLEAYKASLRGEQWWKRKARRGELRAQK